MPPFVVLLLLALGMLVGSLLAGCIPLFFPFSPRGFNYISLLGAGLLTGTVLTVILPEGIESIYNAAEHAEKGQDSSDSKTSHKVNAHIEVGLALLLGFVIMLLIDRCFGTHYSHSHSEGEGQPSSALPLMGTGRESIELTPQVTNKKV